MCVRVCARVRIEMLWGLVMAILNYGFNKIKYKIFYNRTVVKRQVRNIMSMN